MMELKTINTKSKKSLYLKSEIEGYKAPDGVHTGGDVKWHNENLRELSEKYDLCIVDQKSGCTTYWVKDYKFRDDIIKTAKEQAFLKDEARTEFDRLINQSCFNEIPSTIKKFLEDNGFNVIQFGDTGNFAYALTSECICLSSNGFCIQGILK